MTPVNIKQSPLKQLSAFSVGVNIDVAVIIFLNGHCLRYSPSRADSIYL